MPIPDRISAVAVEAMAQDSSLTADVAELLAEEAIRLVASGEATDAPSLARALIAQHPDLGVSAANHVAVATLG